MRRTTKSLDRRIEEAYYACAYGLTINMLDIGKIYAAGRQAAAAGASVEEAVRAAVAQYRQN